MLPEWEGQGSLGRVAEKFGSFPNKNLFDTAKICSHNSFQQGFQTK